MRQLNSSTTSNEEFDKSWSLLSEAFHAIYEQNAGNYTFEELYRNAYQIVLNKNADKLHAGFRAIVSDNLEKVNRQELDVAHSAIAKAEQSDSTIAIAEARLSFLREMHSVWSFHVTCLGMMSDVLRYMDKVATRDQKLPRVRDAGYTIYRDTLLRSANLPSGQRMTKTILDCIESERNGAIVDRSLLKACLGILTALSAYGGPEVAETVYSADFEEQFLQESRQFYSKEAAKTIQELPASDYLLYVDRRLKEEEDRIAHYLSEETSSRLEHIVEHETISTYVQNILDMGIASMLLNDRMTDLSNLHRLLSRVDPQTVEFNKALTLQIVAAGDQINVSIMEDNTSPTNDKGSEKVSATTLALRWVQEVLDLRQKYDIILLEAFHSHQDVKNTMTRAFSQFINKNGRSAEFVSLFIDDNLKKGLKGKTEQEVDTVLEKTVSLFRYISDKDVFERYYKTHLAKRLLNSRSVSDDAERGMIAKLKVEVGSTFTSKMEGMFKDMKISTDTMKDFRKFEEKNEVCSTPEMTVSVLTSTFWPVGTVDTAAATCLFPPEVERRKEAFQKFYLNRHSGRQLTWLPSHGTADMRGTFGKRKYDLNVSTYAMVILLQFNSHASLTFTDLRSMTSIPESELSRNLQSLACAKYKILTKEPRSRDVKVTDSFSINSTFTSPQLRIKIALIANKVETETERKDTFERIEETRKHQTEACIVRTMKARKQMENNNLVAEVTSQLMPKFNPDPIMIKSRIEALIEREYLERDENDRRVYKYLA